MLQGQICVHISPNSQKNKQYSTQVKARMAWIILSFMCKKSFSIENFYILFNNTMNWEMEGNGDNNGNALNQKG